jgi:hypothetical protein
MFHAWLLAWQGGKKMPEPESKVQIESHRVPKPKPSPLDAAVALFPADEQDRAKKLLTAVATFSKAGQMLGVRDSNAIVAMAIKHTS